MAIVKMSKDLKEKMGIMIEDLEKSQGKTRN